MGAFLTPYIGTYLGWKAAKPAVDTAKEAKVQTPEEKAAAEAEKAAQDKKLAEEKAKLEAAKKAEEEAKKEAEKSFFTWPVIAVIGVGMLAVLGAAIYFLGGEDV